MAYSLYHVCSHVPSVYSSALRTSTLSASATAFASFSFTSACVLPRTLLMIRLPFFHRIQRYIALPIAHPCAFEYCPRRLPVSLPCSCLLRFGSTNNYHRRGAKSTDFFGRSEYFQTFSHAVKTLFFVYCGAVFALCPSFIAFHFAGIPAALGLQQNLLFLKKPVPTFDDRPVPAAARSRPGSRMPAAPAPVKWSRPIRSV